MLEVLCQNVMQSAVLFDFMISVKSNCIIKSYIVYMYMCIVNLHLDIIDMPELVYTGGPHGLEPFKPGILFKFLWNDWLVYSLILSCICIEGN